MSLLDCMVVIVLLFLIIGHLSSKDRDERAEEALGMV